MEFPFVLLAQGTCKCTRQSSDVDFQCMRRVCKFSADAGGYFRPHSAEAALGSDTIVTRKPFHFLPLWHNYTMQNSNGRGGNENLIDRGETMVFECMNDAKQTISFFDLINNFFWDKFHSLFTGMVRRSATVRQLRARKDPQKTAIHPFVPSLFLAKYFLACFKDSATPRPPALLLVHQLTSVPGAASRDLLLVCSGSTRRWVWQTLDTWTQKT